MPAPRLPICPVRNERLSRLWQFGVPLVCWVIPMPQTRHEPPERRHGVEAGGGADIIGGAAGDPLRLFRRVAVDDGAPRLEAFGALFNERRVVQPLVENHLGHRVEQGHVGARVGPQPDVGVVAEVDALGVDDHELGPPLDDGAPHPRRHDGVVRGGVGAGDDETAGVLVVDVRIRRGPAADSGDHRLHRGRVAEACAVVDVVGLHEQAGELLLDVAVLVGCLGRAEGGEGAPVLDELLRHQVKRLVPGRLAERAVFLDERRRQPVGGVDEGRAEAALDAEHPDARQVLGIVEDFENVALRARLERDAASDAAVGAGRRRAIRYGKLRPLLLDGPGGADGEARTARGADRFTQRLVHEGADAGLPPRAEHVDGANELQAGAAALGAASAHDAVVHRDREERAARVDGLPGPWLVARGVDVVAAAGGGQRLVVLSRWANP